MVPISLFKARGLPPFLGLCAPGLCAPGLCAPGYAPAPAALAGPLLAARAVHIERRWSRVGAAVTGVETHAGEGGAGGDGGVPTGVGELGVGAGLRIVGVPGLGDLLVPRP